MSGRWTGVFRGLRWAALGLLITASCARTRVPLEPGSSPSSDLEALERDFEAGAAELAVQLQSQEKDARAGDDRDVAVTDATSESEANASAPAAPAPEASGEGRSAGASSCDLMCRALASMERSARGICTLTSETHERCASARSRLEAATRQVKDAGCVCHS